MKNAIDEIEAAFLAAGRLTKSVDLAKTVADLRATVASLREVDSRIAALEKQADAEQAARYGYGVADSDRARISQLESELASLRASESSAGLAKTLERGCATEGPKTEQSSPAGRAVDWRQ
jgi:uncharacterized protein YhbP (UPF0306 family)